MLDLLEFWVSGYKCRLVFKSGGEGKTTCIGNAELCLILGGFENQLVWYGKDFDTQALNRCETFDFFHTNHSVAAARARCVRSDVTGCVET